MEKPLPPEQKVKPTLEAMLMSLSTMLLWWYAEREKAKAELEPGWTTKCDILSKCIADVKAKLENWERFRNQ